MDHIVRSQMVISHRPCLSQVQTSLDLSEELAGGNNFLVDAGISYRDFLHCGDYTYATKGVKVENEGWADFLENDHFLKSCTREDFKASSGLVTLTAFDAYGPEATVRYNTEVEAITCGHCGVLISGTLTSGGMEVYACQKLSSTDFSSLVRAVAFPRTFTLLTNEGCLGWCSAPLNSWSLEKHIARKWKSVYFY